MRYPSERDFRRVGRVALMIGFGVLVVSVILFVLSNALVDQAGRLIGEGNYAEGIDVANLADYLGQGAWVTLGVAIVSLVIGLIAYVAGQE